VVRDPCHPGSTRASLRAGSQAAAFARSRPRTDHFCASTRRGAVRPLSRREHDGLLDLDWFAGERIELLRGMRRSRAHAIARPSGDEPRSPAVAVPHRSPAQRW